MNDIREIIDKYQFVVKKYKKKGNVHILDTDNGRFCLKKKCDNKVYETIKYLKSKHFNNFVDFYSEENDRFCITKYIDDDNLLKEDKAIELIYLISMLHNRTTFYKSISLDEVKCFYEEKINQLNDIRNYYDNLCYVFDNDVFISPSKYLLLRNISLIFKSVDYSKKYLDMWYEIMKNKKSKRVVLNHNNLDLSHILISGVSYLINWEKAYFDTPVVDLCHFFRKEFLNVDIKMLFNVYLSKYQFLKEEFCLLNSVLLIPFIIEFDNYEIENSKKVYELVCYLNYIKDFVLENNLGCDK